MLTVEQKAARESSLGSSDAPIVAGVSPYKSPLELYYQLHGELPRYTDDETQAQRIGSKLEPMIAELAAEDLGLKIRRTGTKRHTKYPFMVASLDFEIVNNAKGPGVLEIKNRGASKPFDTVPDDIHLQVVQQMAVTNRDWGIVAVLFGFGVLKTYEVQRDRELESYLIELEARFMLRVQRSEPPDATWTPETVGMLKKLYPTSNGVTIEFPHEKRVLINEYQSARLALERAEEEKAKYQGLIQDIMRDADTAEVPDWGKITWRSTKARQDFDEEAFKKVHPDLYAQFMITKPGYRRFLVTPNKGLVKHE